MKEWLKLSFNFLEHLVIELPISLYAKELSNSSSLNCPEGQLPFRGRPAGLRSLYLWGQFTH